MRRIIVYFLALALIGVGVAWAITMPRPLSDDALSGHTGDAARGEAVFNAAGCAACHMAPKAEDDARLVLAGGQRFPSPFGTFVAPNISPDPEHGIGGWGAADLANAMLRGVSPEGAHYYPVFPYTSYAKMRPEDAVDLHAYLQTLSPTQQENAPHEVGFPFNIRRLLGGWKTLFLNDDWVLETADTEEIARGRYLVEALGHCAECHTPRDALGVLQRDQWLAGAANPTGDGRIPGISPDKLDWNAQDIAYYLQSGLTPEYDSAGGHMVAVIDNISRLPDSDRAAIAAYLKALP
ncbi:Cytochrome c, mono-and diheme variants [Salinihabitans flavidus]|uniref:Cytochrome c, mono-and diheme variants n=1 Tax=Salinihabitans flavidus TaxID=569882 RepID=A0A1H8NJW9_9RHOB|nr:cytochrome c [Salinihabitans flavidus]SEO29895.1 Cytochrome c, mono-and diheme variants [Salinihabitans flavidus]